jgi:hypothetical protein
MTSTNGHHSGVEPQAIPPLGDDVPGGLPRGIDLARVVNKERALARFDPFPEIDGPAPNVPPPDSRIARDANVQRAGGRRLEELRMSQG